LKNMLPIFVPTLMSARDDRCLRIMFDER
jgi:hypothetical protein